MSRGLCELRRANSREGQTFDPPTPRGFTKFLILYYIIYIYIYIYIHTYIHIYIYIPQKRLQTKGETPRKQGANTRRRQWCTWYCPVFVESLPGFGVSSGFRVREWSMIADSCFGVEINAVATKNHQYIKREIYQNETHDKN